MKKIFFVTLGIIALSVNLPAEGKILYQDNYENHPELAVRIGGANQSYTVHFLGIQDNTHAGKGILADVTTKHGINVNLAPRTNASAKALWGNSSPGKAGTFIYPSMDIALEPQKGYVVSLDFCLLEAGEHTKVSVNVQVESDSPHGKIYDSVRFDQQFEGKKDAGKWVKLEQEINSLLFDKLMASGSPCKNVKINAINVSGFLPENGRLAFQADNLVVMEVPYSEVEKAKSRRADDMPGKAYTFKPVEKTENFFPWGAYSSWHGACGKWFYDSAAKKSERERIIKEISPLFMTVMKRHYFNTIIVGGGLIFPGDGQDRRDFIKTALDYSAKYNLRLAPSTYLTRHYHRQATWKQCEDSMKLLVSQIKDHPALLFYHLVDEPSKTNLEDFYRGKQLMEQLDPEHAALCCANTVDMTGILAAKLPLILPDYYPISEDRKGDRGVWAILDNIRHAKANGARTIWLVGQAFGDCGGWRVPTLAEFKIMFYGGLAEGCTGFIPYAYSGGSYLVDPESKKAPFVEGGDLVNPFEKPNRNMEFMKEAGLLFRSAGKFFIGAEKTDDCWIESSNKTTFENNVGRIRPVMPIVERKMRNQEKIHLLVVWNNQLNDRISTILKLNKPGVSLMDADSLKIVRMPSEQTLSPGDGKIYIAADQDSLKKMRSAILLERLQIEADVLSIEIGELEVIGIQTGKLKEWLRMTAAMIEKEKYFEAQAELGCIRKATTAIKDNDPVLVSLEKTRELLSVKYDNLAKKLRNNSKFPIADPKLKVQLVTLKKLGRQFVQIQLDMRKNGYIQAGKELVLLEKELNEL